MTIEQRRALRRWVFQQQKRPSQQQAIQWFFETFQLTIRQSTVSESLSSRYSYLDDKNIQIPTNQRRRVAAWPLLETALFEWQKLIELRGGVTTNEVLQHKARQIWNRLPEYSNQSIPEFSPGWIENF